jgi:hypothetical protein
MLLRTMIWTIVIVIAVVGLWYWYEGGWDRSSSRPRRAVCAKISNADQANAWLREHPETQVLDVRSKGEFEGGALPRRR